MDVLKNLFAAWAGEPCTECLALGAGGSSRRYYRLSSNSRCCIGTVADDVRENEAFFAFTNHFRAKDMPVPELYVVADDRKHYLQQDLGDLTLYGLLYEKKRQGGGFDPEMMSLYRQALTDLAAIQQVGADIDFSIAYPRAAFDSRSIHWDLNYFKYYFLKLANIPFDEQRLEEDFDHLSEFLQQADCHYFLYRDFNPRNIMIVQPEKRRGEMGERLPTATKPLSNLHYIDYQGGRRGATQYDVASLLFSAKSDLPDAYRNELLTHYLDIRQLHGSQRQQWLVYFWGYVLIRILQTLGAYGFRGLYEKKEYFIQSIPLALRNLRNLVAEHSLPIELPELQQALHRLTDSPLATKPTSDIGNKLTVSIQSFSYKQGLPVDSSGNGGGHIFDCRALPNPGRYPQYQSYTGKDKPVIEFLAAEPAVSLFMNHSKGIVKQSVDKYLERHFTHLSVAYGCTGGQHRSVYCAEQLAKWLRTSYPEVQVEINHREQKT